MTAPLNQSISFLLNATTRNMRRYASEELLRRNAGITVDQWGVLKLLEENGNNMTNSRLAELMLKDRPTLTRIIDILCRESLVGRKIDEEDRRQQLICLTTKGRKTVNRVGPVVQQLRDQIVAGLTHKDVDELKRLLSKLYERIEDLRN